MFIPKDKLPEPKNSPTNKGEGWLFSCGKCSHHWWYSCDYDTSQDMEIKEEKQYEKEREENIEKLKQVFLELSQHSPSVSQDISEKKLNKKDEILEKKRKKEVLFNKDGKTGTDFFPPKKVFTKEKNQYLYNRLFSKPISSSKVEGASEAQNRSVLDIHERGHWGKSQIPPKPHEDSSIEATNKFAEEIELQKSSKHSYKRVSPQELFPQKNNLKKNVSNNRFFSKPISSSKVEGASEAQNRSVDIHEGGHWGKSQIPPKPHKDSSIESTNKFAEEIEFRKKSNEHIQSKSPNAIKSHRKILGERVFSPSVNFWKMLNKAKSTASVFFNQSNSNKPFEVVNNFINDSNIKIEKIPISLTESNPYIPIIEKEVCIPLKLKTAIRSNIVSKIQKKAKHFIALKEDEAPTKVFSFPLLEVKQKSEEIEIQEAEILEIEQNEEELQDVGKVFNITPIIPNLNFKQREKKVKKKYFRLFKAMKINLPKRSKFIIIWGIICIFTIFFTFCTVKYEQKVIELWKISNYTSSNKSKLLNLEKVVYSIDENKIIIMGEIVNSQDYSISVPAVTISVSNKSKQKISWKYFPLIRNILPHEHFSFKTKNINTLNSNEGLKVDVAFS
ncbi:MAG: hypothetical protein LBS83_02500 [Holosporales bacterium]|nr:hypothetical protein [Holosporales bacterium]